MRNLQRVTALVKYQEVHIPDQWTITELIFYYLV